MKEVRYINPKQEFFVLQPQKTKAFIGGRGTGKSVCLGFQTKIRATGVRTAKRTIYNPMPRAKFGLFGPTYEHLKNRVVPSVLTGLRTAGLIEHIEGKQLGDFVKFKKPPKWFKEPYDKPEDYSNIITLSNGYTIQLFSWNNADLIRGINLDGADIDEAALMPKEIFDTVIFPAIRGNTWRFAKTPLHQQICFYTSMPWLTAGQWVLEYEQLAKKYPNDVCFVKSTSWDNVEVLGHNTLLRWKREMDALSYKVEIMCEQVGRIANCYYHQFDEREHCYVDVDHHQLDPDEPLIVSFDFGGKFTCALLCQHIGSTIYVHREFFVKGGNLLESIVKLIADSLPEHRDRDIYIYGDKQGTHRALSYVSADIMTYYEKIQAEFRKHGFSPMLMKLGLNPGYIERSEVINKALKGDISNPLLPRIRINRAGCVYLPLSLSKAPIKNDFSKDKSSESDANVPPEQSTHLSDAFDYVVFNIASKPLKPIRARRQARTT